MTLLRRSLLLAVCATTFCGVGQPVAWAQMSKHVKAVAHQPLPVMPQDDVLPATLAAIYQNRIDIDQALVVVDMGQGPDNPQWLMSATQREVLLDTLLQFMPDKPQPEDAIWPQLKPRDPAYKGIRVMLRNVWGRNFAPFTIFEGKVVAENGAVLVPDHGRRLEYWMFGTSRIRRDQLVGAHVLPVLTFEQCRLLGQQIVHTRPRQCLLPDNNLLLETAEMPTLKSARIKDFDGCLKDGKALIYTFPRRCMAAGGRVFTEPPRVYDVASPTPADAPLLAPNAFALPSLDGSGLQLNSQLGGPLQSTVDGGLGTPLLP
ncbi:MAG: hypothetical protein DI585_03910 [Pseudomonas fluorescens]|nr:MAG: hypothetical protein DI585_03910 [Pseudomonas fluorescens]